ncbi:LACCASE [Salix koriyanagi]|uniref:LACCASE n=1 Tax=Salix koriyanagi TaxID=2511006 RepID=A0A9Q0WJB6_9ROSI|nr:LACCASE [Salix koriyanagi]
MPPLPFYNDTATVTAFSRSFRSPRKVEVPTDIDENLFFTIGLGLNNCPKNFRARRCQGPNGTRFTATKPPVKFDYTGNVSRSLYQPVPGTKAVQVEVRIKGAGFGNFNPKTDKSKFNLVDPPMRNTVAVPVNGWAVIRFVADNPGVWLMHCHLDVHIAWGLAMAFLVEDGVGKITECRASSSRSANMLINIST